MLYLLLDESGDLGFDFVQKKPSKYFVITIVVVDGSEDRKILKTAIKRTLRHKLNAKKKNKASELKAKSTSLEIKQYAYKYIHNIPFTIYSLVVDKRKSLEALAKNKAHIYNYITRQLLDKITLHSSQIELVMDRSKSREEIQEFNEYVISHLQAKISPRTPFQIYHIDSELEPLIQWADLFAWGILRKYEKNDLSWYNHFKDHIKYEQLFK